MYRVIRCADDKALKWDEQVQWVQDNLGIEDRYEASSIISSLEFYTNMGYHGVHTRDFDTYTTCNQDAEREIDFLLTHPKMPKFHGTCYRGLNWSNHKLELLEDILNSGTWYEPGITSFSYDKADAKKFAFETSLTDPIMITLKNSKHGCAIGFLSQGGGEGEVLFPSKICMKGFKIVDWYKEIEYSTRVSKKTGQPWIVHTRYYVTCTE